MMNVVKKILNIVLIMFGVVLIIVCADLVLNKMSKTEFSQLDETDREAIEEICSMTALFDEKYGCDEVWTEDYNLRKKPCVVTRSYGMLKGRTYTVNMTIRKSIFAQRIRMPDEYIDIPVYRMSYLYPLTFSLSNLDDGEYVEIEGDRAYASRFDAQNVRLNGTGSLEEALVETTFKDSIESVDVPSSKLGGSFEVTDENVALMGLQYRIIDDMLGADTREHLDELIAEYVKVREYQSEKFPAMKNRRLATEISEGSSKYVFYNISRLIGHDLTYFNKEETESITFYSAYYYLCTGRYNSDIGVFLNETSDVYSGAALCRIIDENELCEDWQRKLDGEKLVSQYTLLKRYCDEKCGKYSEKTIDDIKRTYNYEEIISMARTLCNEVA